MLAEHFRELRRYAIPPSNYLREAKRGKSPQRQELAHLYAAYDAEAEQRTTSAMPRASTGPPAACSLKIVAPAFWIST